MNIYNKNDYYQEYLDELKVNLDDEFDLIEHSLDIDCQKFYDFADAFKDDALTKWYGPRPFYDFDSMRQAVFLNSLGYNEHNSFEYNWGIEPEHNNILKELVGKHNFDHLNVDYDTVGIRLLQYNPGNGIPLHTDSFNAYKTQNGSGNITRYFVAISPWDWGHFLQVHDKMIHHWKPGYTLEIPDGVFHLSANFGIAPKLTLTITGFVNE